MSELKPTDDVPPMFFMRLKALQMAVDYVSANPVAQITRDSKCPIHQAYERFSALLGVNLPISLSPESMPDAAKQPKAPLSGGQGHTPPEGEKRPSPPPAPPRKPLATLGDKLIDCAKQLHDAQSAHHRKMAEEAARLWKKLDQPQQGDPTWKVDCKPILKALGIDAAKGIDILAIQVRSTLPTPPFIHYKRHGEMQYRNNEDGKLYEMEFTVKEK
jgi:hypothetical protein